MDPQIQCNLYQNSSWSLPINWGAGPEIHMKVHENQNSQINVGKKKKHKPAELSPLNLKPPNLSLNHKAPVIKTAQVRTSLVVQWTRIHLPMQGTRVWPRVQEDPHAGRNQACKPQLLKPACLQPLPRNEKALQEEAPLDATREEPVQNITEPGQPVTDKE